MTDQMKYVSKLKGQKILIIGGSSGIGYGVAEASIEHGATAIISSSNQTRVEGAVSRIRESYPSFTDKISGHACDLGNEATLEQNLTALFDKVGQVDHIVYTAGDSLAITKIGDATMEGIKKAGTVRFFGPLMVGKLGPKYLKQGPSSSIVFTTGAVSERPIADWSVVAGFATGLHGLTRALALDLKPLRVNLVSPGAVDTDLWAGMPDEHKKAFFAAHEAKVPTGKMGQVEDVAESYIYLMKDKNITGSIISTNSGALLI